MNNFYGDIEKMVKIRMESDKREYTPLINAGVAAQLEKLRENEHKRGFDDIDIEYANTRLSDEMEELTKELYEVSDGGGCTLFFRKENRDFSKIRHEAADIMNFAAMIVLKCDQNMRLENEK